MRRAVRRRRRTCVLWRAKRHRPRCISLKREKERKRRGRQVWRKNKLVAERRAGLKKKKKNSPVRKTRFRRPGAPLRAKQNPRLFAHGRILPLPLSCSGRSRIGKQLPRQAATERDLDENYFKTKKIGNLLLTLPSLLCIAIMRFDGYL